MRYFLEQNLKIVEVVLLERRDLVDAIIDSDLFVKLTDEMLLDSVK